MCLEDFCAVLDKHISCAGKQLKHAKTGQSPATAAAEAAMLRLERQLRNGQNPE